jgi:hypothetical protein
MGVKYLGDKRQDGVSAVQGGAVLVCRKVGTSIYVFYNNALIGTATISDAQVISNTLRGLFSTGGPTEVQLDNFVVYPAGNEGQYDLLNVWSN